VRTRLFASSFRAGALLCVESRLRWNESSLRKVVAEVKARLRTLLLWRHFGQQNLS